MIVLIISWILLISESEATFNSTKLTFNIDPQITQYEIRDLHIILNGTRLKLCKNDVNVNKKNQFIVDILDLDFNLNSIVPPIQNETYFEIQLQITTNFRTWLVSYLLCKLSGMQTRGPNFASNVKITFAKITQFAEWQIMKRYLQINKIGFLYCRVSSAELEGITKFGLRSREVEYGEDNIAKYNYTTYWAYTQLRALGKDHGYHIIDENMHKVMWIRRCLESKFSGIDEESKWGDPVWDSVVIIDPMILCKRNDFIINRKWCYGRCHVNKTIFVGDNKGMRKRLRASFGDDVDRVNQLSLYDALDVLLEKNSLHEILFYEKIDAQDIIASYVIQDGIALNLDGSVFLNDVSWTDFQ